MNTIEDRLRDALWERARRSPIDPHAWERTQARIPATRKRPAGLRWSRPGRFLIPAGAAAAVVVIVVGVTAAVNGITGRSAGAPGGSPGSASATPGTATSSPFALKGYLRTTPVSAILALPVTSPRTGQTAVAYSWLGYTSPYAWTGEQQGLQSCSEVVYPHGLAAGYCVSLPRLGAGKPASVTSSNGADSILVLQGLAVSRVASVTAVLPDGQHVPGVVKTGRGVPGKAWAVVAPTSGKTLSPVSGERLVFRDASGAEVATLGTTAAVPLLVAKPSSGGILAFRAPCCGSVYAYLIDGYVGFFWGKPGWMAPQLAAGFPALAGLSTSFVSLWEAFGYAHADVARVVIHLGGGRQVATSTSPAWPGSGLRLWAVRLPGQPEFDPGGIPVTTMTGYDAAGDAIAQVTLGTSG
jgi:hypothetical protein